MALPHRQTTASAGFCSPGKRSAPGDATTFPTRVRCAYPGYNSRWLWLLLLLLLLFGLSRSHQNNETPGTSHNETPANPVPITVAANTSLG